MENFFLALRIRQFLYLWLSELFSQIAMNMMNFILLLVAFDLTQSNTAVSGIVLSFTIPAIIFGILAGVYVDRWNKKYVLVITNVLRMFLLLSLAVLYNNLLAVYSVSFLVAIVTQFFIPAETPMIPLLVPKQNLFAANALFSTAWFGSVFIAYAISGPFLLVLGTRNALIALCIIFLIAAIFAALIKVPAVVEKKKKELQGMRKSFIAEVHQTFKLIIKIQEVYHALFILACAQILTLIIAVLGPGYSQTVLHINIDRFPLLFVTPAVIGIGCGAYLVTNFFSGLSRHKSATLGLFIGAAALLVMPHVVQISSVFTMINPSLPPLLRLTSLHLMVVIAFILGVANAFMFVPSQTLIQEHTSDEIRGKVYGALNTSASLLSIVPVIMVGSLADIFGVGNVITIIGVLVGIIGILRITL